MYFYKCMHGNLSVSHVFFFGWEGKHSMVMCGSHVFFQNPFPGHFSRPFYDCSLTTQRPGDLYKNIPTLGGWDGLRWWVMTYIHIPQRFHIEPSIFWSLKERIVFQPSLLLSYMLNFKSVCSILYARWYLQKPESCLKGTSHLQLGGFSCGCLCGPHMGVSHNSGTPKSSFLIGFSIIYHPFWGTPMFGNTHMNLIITYDTDFTTAEQPSDFPPEQKPAGKNGKVEAGIRPWIPRARTFRIHIPQNPWELYICITKYVYIYIYFFFLSICSSNFLYM